MTFSRGERIPAPTLPWSIPPFDEIKSKWYASKLILLVLNICTRAQVFACLDLGATLTNQPTNPTKICSVYYKDIHFWFLTNKVFVY